MLFDAAIYTLNNTKDRFDQTVNTQRASAPDCIIAVMCACLTFPHGATS